MIADEEQTGFGRTGKLFACDHEGVVPDMYILGKAIGGGIVPLSAVVADWDVMDVLTPGSHGSTFGGNPLACAVGMAVLDLVRDGTLFANAAALEGQLRDGLRHMIGFGVDAVRVRGLWAGVVLSDELGTARAMCEELLTRGVLSKDTHGQTLRLSPPLTITSEELAWGLERIAESLAALRATPSP
jgi:ornithine--oxo-acid transaminase